MQQLFIKTTVTVLAAVLIGGCATSARQLMPTPTLYQLPGGQPVFNLPENSQRSPDLDLLFITDRAPPTPAELEAQAKEKGAGPMPYGQERAQGIAYGSRSGSGGAGARLGDPAQAEPARRTHA